MKKIINFTPTGTQPTRENSEAPLSPNEIIEEVHEAYDIGISMVHIHARDEQSQNTWRPEIYEKIITGIRKHCPQLTICASLTGRNFPEFERRSAVIELMPDMGSLTMSSLNFPKGASINEPDMILRLIEKMEMYGVIPEIECFDSGMLNYTNYLINRRILKGPHYINVILGNMYNGQCDLSTVASILDKKPQDSVMCLGGIGNFQLKANMLGLMYADGVRVGLEDNLYYIDKGLATNVKLLKRIHRMMDELSVGLVSSNQFYLQYANKINASREK
jgi:3-keto-5-aminohexanoate cleavage enzyme|tara:strand:+ start:5446 stop:6273 length:828 start_codon:yes stop_codon:yes gene_type:complete